MDYIIKYTSPNKISHFANTFHPNIRKKTGHAKRFLNFVFFLQDGRFGYVSIHRASSHVPYDVQPFVCIHTWNSLHAASTQNTCIRNICYEVDLQIRSLLKLFKFCYTSYSGNNGAENLSKSRETNAHIPTQSSITRFHHSCRTLSDSSPVSCVWRLFGEVSKSTAAHWIWFL